MKKTSTLTVIWTALLAICTFGLIAVSGFFAFLCVYARNVKYSLISAGATILFIAMLFMVLFQGKFAAFHPLVSVFVVEAAIVGSIAFYLLYKL